MHIDDRFIRNGLLDTAAMKPIARNGYHNYVGGRERVSAGASDARVIIGGALHHRAISSLQTLVTAARYRDHPEKD